MSGGLPRAHPRVILHWNGVRPKKKANLLTIWSREAKIQPPKKEKTPR
jgi:hypothetical protein